jgi:CspA family cold shock protein
MPEGKVIFFNMKSKFGFIKENKTGTDYYFYIKKPLEKIEKNDKVTFEIKQAKKGLEAIHVKIIEKDKSK